MVITVSFLIPNLETTQIPLTNEWINKLWCILIVEYYPTTIGIKYFFSQYVR